MVILPGACDPSPCGGSKDLDDSFLIQSLLGGDPAALRRLMQRYDRLVRYTIFKTSSRRCAQDPEWLESVASSTWLGFIRSLRRDPDQPPRVTAAYLAQIARRQALSAVRAESTRLAATEPLPSQDSLAASSDPDEVVNTIAQSETLDALRSCLAALEEDDRTLVSQLCAITDRRWREAAAALGLKESTLRSRWERTMERLRQCLTGKTGKKLAPPGLPVDL